jgi:hypothetical protein
LVGVAREDVADLLRRHTLSVDEGPSLPLVYRESNEKSARGGDVFVVSEVDRSRVWDGGIQTSYSIGSFTSQRLVSLLAIRFRSSRKAAKRGPFIMPTRPNL